MTGARPSLAWFERDVTAVARDLLGALLTTFTPEGAVTIRITEVEAYGGPIDPGSHAFHGRTRRNAVMFGEPGRLYVYRHLGLHHCMNIVVGPPGTAAAVLLRAGEVVDGKALALARRMASGVVRSDVDLARGPARLAVALGIDLAWYGRSVLDDDALALRVPAAQADGGTVAGPAIGERAGPATVGSVDAGPGARAGAAPDVDARPGWEPGSCVGAAPTPGVARARVVASGPRVGVSGDGGDARLFPWRFWLAGDRTVSAYRAAGSRRSTFRATAASRQNGATSVLKEKP